MEPKLSKDQLISMQQSLVGLGYACNANGNLTAATANALRKYLADRNLPSINLFAITEPPVIS